MLDKHCSWEYTPGPAGQVVKEKQGKREVAHTPEQPVAECLAMTRLFTNLYEDQQHTKM